MNPLCVGARNNRHQALCDLVNELEQKTNSDPENPENASTYFHMGNTLDRLGLYVNAFDRQRFYSQAVEAYKKAIKCKPGNTMPVFTSIW